MHKCQQHMNSGHVHISCLRLIKIIGTKRVSTRLMSHLTKATNVNDKKLAYLKLQIRNALFCQKSSKLNKFSLILCF